MKPAVGAIVPYFGSNRMLASKVGELLGNRLWIGVPFAGSMAEIPYMQARTIIANDLHKWIINLARVMKDGVLGPKLYRRLRRRAFHDHELREAQMWCKAHEPRIEVMDANINNSMFGNSVNPNDSEYFYCDLESAEMYFVSQWMNRSAKSGTDGEFNGSLPVRWDGAGGDSATRYFSAARSIVQWRSIFRKVNFLCMDAFDFINKVKDDEFTFDKKTRCPNGLYCDPPFPGPGEAYRHKMAESDFVKLERMLSAFNHVRCVCRFYHDDPMIRDIFSDSRWTWVELVGRKASNKASPEVLIYRN